MIFKYKTDYFKEILFYLDHGTTGKKGEKIFKQT
tara:strand:- start:414 stop:515 length:102 start_codon:yes stop_codon:yes gene_type:complete